MNILIFNKKCDKLKKSEEVITGKKKESSDGSLSLKTGDKSGRGVTGTDTPLPPELRGDFLNYIIQICFVLV